MPTIVLIILALLVVYAAGFAGGYITGSERQ